MCTFCEDIQTKTYGMILESSELMNKFIRLKEIKNNIDMLWENTKANMEVFLCSDEKITRSYSEVRQKVLQYRQ